MKNLYYIFERFRKRNLKKTVIFYLMILTIFLIFGVGGLMIAFFLILSFALGWWTKTIVQIVKDYRLTLRLNRISFTSMEYETMKKERDAFHSAYEALKKWKLGGRGVTSPPAPQLSSLFKQAEMEEELKLRMQMEGEKEFHD